MYASMYLHERYPPTNPRRRLAVFSRDGISGATTREIARVAKVNEVTLFRYFKNKNELLRQAVMCSASRYEHVFAEAALESPEPTCAARCNPTPRPTPTIARE